MSCVGNVRGCLSDISSCLHSGPNCPTMCQHLTHHNEPNDGSVKMYVGVAGHCSGKDAQGRYRNKHRRCTEGDTGEGAPTGDCSPFKKLSGAEDNSERQKQQKKEPTGDWTQPSLTPIALPRLSITCSKARTAEGICSPTGMGKEGGRVLPLRACLAVSFTCFPVSKSVIKSTQNHQKTKIHLNSPNQDCFSQNKSLITSKK